MAKGKRDRRASIRSMATDPSSLDPRLWEQPDKPEPAEDRSDDQSSESSDDE